MSTHTVFVVVFKFQKFSDWAWSSRNRCMNRFGGSGFWIDFVMLWLRWRRWWRWRRRLRRLRSNSLLIVEVWCWQCILLLSSGRRRSRMCRKYAGWCTCLWLGKLRRTGLSRLIGSNWMICCWFWQDILPKLSATWRLCNLCASFNKSGLLALGNRKRIMVVSPFTKEMFNFLCKQAQNESNPNSLTTSLADWPTLALYTGLCLSEYCQYSTHTNRGTIANNIDNEPKASNVAE